MKPFIRSLQLCQFWLNSYDFYQDFKAEIEAEIGSGLSAQLINFYSTVLCFMSDIYAVRVASESEGSAVAEDK